MIVAETRRRWLRAEKQTMVAETSAASVSAIARKHGIASSLLFRWRREFGGGGRLEKPVSRTALRPKGLPAPSASDNAAMVTHGGLIEIELVRGRRIRMDASVDVAALKRVIAVLEER